MTPTTLPVNYKMQKKTGFGELYLQNMNYFQFNK